MSMACPCRSARRMSGVMWPFECSVGGSSRPVVALATIILLGASPDLGAPELDPLALLPHRGLVSALAGLVGGEGFRRVDVTQRRMRGHDRVHPGRADA